MFKWVGGDPGRKAIKAENQSPELATLSKIRYDISNGYDIIGDPIGGSGPALLRRPEPDHNRLSRSAAMDRSPSHKQLRRSTLHERVIDAILARHPNAQRLGFGKALRKLFDLEGWRPGVIPDAFIIDPIAKKVTAFEVEVSSWLSDRQYAGYADVWWQADGEEWTLEIITVDGNGMVTSHVDGKMIALNRLAVEALKNPETSERRLAETRALMAEFAKIQQELLNEPE